MKRSQSWIGIALAAIVLGGVCPAGAYAARALGVEVWTDRGDDAVYQAGDAMQLKVRASDDAYLIVYEIDSNGHISVLYPWRRGANLVEGHHTYRLPPEQSGYELAVEKATGEGYVVAIASRRPFRDLPWYLRTFDPQAEGNGYEDRHDDEEGFDKDGNVVGDPMVAMERIRRRVLDQPSDTEDFAASYATYYVGQEVRYPRYLCADCHRPGQWAWWDGFDPYYSRCSVFDFRVNWNWAWGPSIWTGDVPYYFYVVRSDCPPRYHDWYDRHSRWSSWDGHHTWSNLWGGNLVRYKSPPPQGYVPPPSGKPAWNPGSGRPPGYLPSTGNNWRRGGFRAPMPVGQAARGPRQYGGTRFQAPNPMHRAQPGEGNRNDGNARPARPEARQAPVERRAPAEQPARRETPRQPPAQQDPPRREGAREAPAQRDGGGTRADGAEGGHRR